MTQKLFWEDPYLTRLDTSISSVNGDDITVEKTIFYAEAGGQESDMGTLEGRPVLMAQKDGKEIIYTLETGHGLKQGDPVRIEIDWERRYKLMRLHFAAEIVLEFFYRTLKGVEKIGAHIGEEKARLDFVWHESISPLFEKITRNALQIIKGDLEIESAFSDENEEKRYWKIENFAQVPCGGTHLKRTGEVGSILLKRKNIGKGKERVEIYLA